MRVGETERSGQTDWRASRQYGITQGAALGINYKDRTKEQSKICGSKTRINSNGLIDIMIPTFWKVL